MQKTLLLFFILFSGISVLNAQLEGIKVETYYISDDNDATDEFGGTLEVGTTTYRIYVDMAPGSKLLKIYGDQNHPLNFSSTEKFFNHLEDGVTFAKDLNRNRYEEGTVALDSWLTIGQISRPFSAGVYFGIPKNTDPDGSIIGGINNDGGSQGIAEGLLANEDPDAGLPLTTADGIIIDSITPSNWVDVDFTVPLTGEDNTIFGANDTNDFSSVTAILQNDGTSSPLDSDNEVIIAQLTTKGDLSFQINLEIEFEEEGILKRVKYVSSDSVLLQGEIFDPLLSFPWTCGCKDPAFLEASPNFACEDNSLCLTPVVYGCQDTSACNYDPLANLNLEDLCCYVGYCNDRDLSLVCPDLPLRNPYTPNHFKLFPNPANQNIQIAFDIDNIKKELPYQVYDILGRKMIQGVMIGKEHQIDISNFQPGAYYIQFLIDNEWMITKSFSVL